MIWAGGHLVCDLTSVSGATAARSVGFIWNGRGAEIENHTHTCLPAGVVGFKGE